MLGSARTGLGSVPTAAGDDSPGGGGGGGGGGGATGVIGKFSGTLVQEPVAASLTYLSDVGELAPTPFINDGTPQLYPTSARTISALRVTSKSGTGGKALVVTLYKNGAPTAMAVTIPASSAPGTTGVDGAHPIAFAAGDTFDVVASMVSGTGDGPYFLSAVLEGTTGGSGGGSGGPVDSVVSGLTFPIVAGTPTLTATDPVVLPGLETTGELEALNGYLLQGPPGSRVIDSPDITGSTTLTGSLDVTGPVELHPGSPLQVDDAFSALDGYLLQGPPGSRVIDSPDISGTTTITGGATYNAQPLAVQIKCDTVNVSGVELSAVDASSLTIGALAWVASVGAYFQLQVSALTVDHLTVETASGLGGAQWLRMNWRNPVWQAQTAWFVNTATGSDEAAGSVGAPLKTMSEAARRLSYAVITVATTVTLIGNMASTDKANWTFICKLAFGFTIKGTPTLLYSGTVTTATNISPAPTTTDNELTDTAIPVSFTASGLLATAVLFKRTSDGACWWAMKDLGSKTIRISQPAVILAGADTTLANGDAYTASQLPSLAQMSFAETFPVSIVLSSVWALSGYALREQSVYAENAWFDSPNVAASFFDTCAFKGTGSFKGSIANVKGTGGFANGMWIGNGSQAFTIFGCSNAFMQQRVSWQGVGCIVQTGSFLQIEGDFVTYDLTGVGTVPLTASYWSEVLWSSGAFGGSNNLAIASADRMGLLAHITNPNWVAGSATGGTPIVVSGTAPMSVAAESAGGGVTNTQANGIFTTS